jgi:hypothetical protein
VEKYCGVAQATDGDMAHVRCMLDTQGCTHSDYVIKNYPQFPDITLPADATQLIKH